MGLRVLQGKQVVQAVFYFSDDLQSTAGNPICFLNCLKPQNLLQPSPSPRGGGLGRGHSLSCGNLSQHLNRPNTSLAACCPLSNSLPRERGRGGCWGLRVLQGKQVVQAAFCFSDDLQSTVVNPSCFSNRLQPQNLLQSAPSPVGEGWGEGILQVAATFPNTPTA